MHRLVEEMIIMTAINDNFILIDNNIIEYKFTYLLTCF